MTTRPSSTRRFALALPGLLLLLAGASSARADFLFVSRGDTTITRIDTNTKIETTFASTGPVTTQGLAFDSSGNLYAALYNTSAPTIQRFTPGGIGSVFASTLGGPLGLAFDGKGNLYVAIGNTIERFTPGGVASVFASTGLNNPIGLAFDSSGNLYVANSGDNTIERFTPGGVGSVFASTGLSLPYGLAFDSLGNLYAANFGSSTIERFTPGGVGSVFASIGVSNPRGLAFDSSGNLYVANGDNTIERFTPGGVGTLFKSESATPIFFAFQPSAVPEPSAIVLIGLGGLALLAHARLKRRGAR